MNRNVRVTVNGAPRFDLYTCGTGEQIQTHTEIACRTRFCVVHRPWSGPWSSWPTTWSSGHAKMFRICEHRVPHPVAEDYLRMNGYSLQHDCCGCPCRPEPLDITRILREEWIIDGEVVDNRLEIGE